MKEKIIIDGKEVELKIVDPEEETEIQENPDDMEDTVEIDVEDIHE